MIIGLSGKAFSGKDSVADYILDNYYWDRKIGFADNLKEACVEIFDLKWDQVLTQQGKSTNLPKPVIINHNILLKLIRWMRKTHNVALQYRPHLHLYNKELRKPRDILQFVGTEVMRHYASDYHCEVVFRTISPSEKIIITDVRFPNEAKGVLSNGGHLVRVERPKELKLLCDVNLNSNHTSETALDSWTSWSYVIKNNENVLSSLHKKVDEMLKELEI
jgi:hypothetical protein